MATPREVYGKGGLYTTLDTIKGMAERKGVSYSPLENVVGKEKGVYGGIYYYNLGTSRDW